MFPGHDPYLGRAGAGLFYLFIIAAICAALSTTAKLLWATVLGWFS